ncbi:MULTISPECIES: DUF2789 family protein [Stenotrophomonas]|jgi:hypothetical protein|uniref:DUF2789 family protein n=1 Tax=Stenotrophomonas TaxID=40323 RepID=UPI001CF1870E|nr:MULTISPECIES: DUF2789 family protein [Stenotrophomonas]MCA7024640.1 DUF2789 family protein [Stenotrophomonas acidaminiphila]MCE4076445.1 DUF2789 family protein [Stenotrophomonas acidaminiphila]
MRNLFLPRGLAADDPTIVRLARGHRLPLETGIEQTPPWNKGQHQFVCGKIDDGGAGARLVARSSTPLHAHTGRARITG